ncbi:hypothetical protein T4D_5733 [Trichinella pseudospiralis]|uniref:Uncharacterized protein n=1 Tax=Trichinella pseudospiralis TaxID=6337 RepID=A0A0V1FEG0_TRIPS|nr:hypothetical protein T4D_5733 [Trichinella pseudospiralis]
MKIQTTYLCNFCIFQSMRLVGCHNFASSFNMFNQFSSNKKANTHTYIYAPKMHNEQLHINMRTVNPANFKREKNERIFIVGEDRRVFNRENVPKAIP